MFNTKKRIVFKKKYFIKASFLIGIVLLSLNIIGLFVPSKNKAIYTEPKTYFKNDTTLTPTQSLELLKNYQNINTINDITKINDIFNRGIAHHWLDEDLTKYDLTIPIYKNWILYIGSLIKPSVYKRYEFYNYRRILKRGIGSCSQQTIALVNFLSKHNITSDIIALNGHVVTQVHLPNKKKIIADPDFGVIIPMGISEIENNPEIIKKYYTKNSRLHTDPILMKKLITIYKNGNRIYPNIHSYYSGTNPKKIIIEKYSYILIWLIPLLLLIFSYFKQRNNLKK